MSRAFLFGKMPSHGDFVARGLGAEERESLDRWLSSELAVARDAFGEGFDRSYESAPPWRFAWLDRDWTAGAMVNSVDSVGRRFPLLVGCAELAGSQVEAATVACEDAIYSAFENGWSADELIDSVEGISPTEGEGNPQETWWTLGGEEFEPASLPGRCPHGLLTAVLGGTSRAAA